jgi:hypothetical protein
MVDPNPNPAGGGTETKIDANDPAIQSLISDAVKTATSGLMSKNEELLTEKKTAQQKLEEVNNQWKGYDPDAVRSLLDKMSTDEDTKLIAEGKIDEVISRRTEALSNDYESKLQAAHDQNGALSKSVEEMNGRVKSLVVDRFVREAAAEHSMVPSAVEDAISRAGQVFKLNEELQPEARDSHEAIMIGKDGKTPLSVQEWIEGMKEKAPHWFPSQSGAGAQGGNQGASGSFTITKSQSANARVYQEAKAAAEQAGVPLQIIDG